MSLPVRTTPEADAQIHEIDDWWRRNRPAALDLFLEELTASFEIIGHAPQIGRLYRQSPVPGARTRLPHRMQHGDGGLLDILPFSEGIAPRGRLELGEDFVFNMAGFGQVVPNGSPRASDRVVRRCLAVVRKICRFF